MKLKELFQNLALGDLVNTPFVGLNGYELDKTKLPRVINAINQALTYIHTTFFIKQKQVIVRINDFQTNYYLDSDYSITNHLSKHHKYIVDTDEDKFLDDVLQVLGVFDLQGHALPLNDSFAVGSIHTPEYNCIQVTDAIKRMNINSLVVVYKANHRTIPLNEPLDSELTISLPSSYDSLLQAYVAYLLYMNMGKADTVNLSSQYFAKVNTLTQQLTQQGIGVINQTGTNVRPQLRGWI